MAPAPAQPPQWAAMTPGHLGGGHVPRRRLGPRCERGALAIGADASQPAPAAGPCSPGAHAAARDAGWGALGADEAARLYRHRARSGGRRAESACDVAAAPDGTTWWLLADGWSTLPVAVAALPTDGRPPRTAAAAVTTSTGCRNCCGRWTGAAPFRSNVCMIFSGRAGPARPGHRGRWHGAGRDRGWNAAAAHRRQWVVATSPAARAAAGQVTQVAMGAAGLLPGW